MVSMCLCYPYESLLYGYGNSVSEIASLISLNTEYAFQFPLVLSLRVKQKGNIF